MANAALSEAPTPETQGLGFAETPPPRRWEASPRRKSGGESRAALWVTAVPLASRRRMLVVEVANGRSLVWGAEAVQALRERLGVGGRTVGALPRGPRQNSRLGLPLLLMPEEARLLAEIGAVTLVSAPRPDPRQHSLVRGQVGGACGRRGWGQQVPEVGGVWESWILEYCESRILGSPGSRP